MELERIVNKYLYMSQRRLAAKYKDHRTRGLDLLVIGILLKGMRGDVHAGNFFMERLVGKVKTTVEVTNPDAAKVPIEERLTGMSDGELQRRYEELKKKAKDDGES